MKRRCFLKSLAVVAAAPTCLASLPTTCAMPNPEWYTAEYETLFAFESCPRTLRKHNHGRESLRRYAIMPDGLIKEVFPFKIV